MSPLSSKGAAGGAAEAAGGGVPRGDGGAAEAGEATGEVAAASVGGDVCSNADASCRRRSERAARKRGRCGSASAGVGGVPNAATTAATRPWLPLRWMVPPTLGWRRGRSRAVQPTQINAGKDCRHKIWDEKSQLKIQRGRRLPRKDKAGGTYSDRSCQERLAKRHPSLRVRFGCRTEWFTSSSSANASFRFDAAAPAALDCNCIRAAASSLAEAFSAAPAAAFAARSATAAADSGESAAHAAAGVPATAVLGLGTAAGAGACIEEILSHQGVLARQVSAVISGSVPAVCQHGMPWFVVW